MIKRICWIIQKVYFHYKYKHFSADLLSLSVKSTYENNVILYGATTVSHSAIGRYTYLSTAKVSHAKIGRFCSIGYQVIIGGGSHPVSMGSTHPAFYSTMKQAGGCFVEKNLFMEYKGSVIGNDVWIGQRSIILDGVIVGDGSIIAAGSVVTKDVEPYSIVGGVPAKLIKYRIRKEYIEDLLEIQWWNWEEALIKKYNNQIYWLDIPALKNAKNQVLTC